MELYAAGFNAWHQLDFVTSTSTSDTPEPEPEPDDIYAFTSRLSGSEIGHPVSRTSYTLVPLDGKLVSAGFPNKSPWHPPSQDDGRGHDLSQDYRSAVNAYGHALELQGSGEDAILLLTTPEKGQGGQERLDLGRVVVQVAAFQAGFAVLSADGSVWTSGDERFPHCLAWDADATSNQIESGGKRWNRVHWLDEIPQGPIVKIDAGGYVLGALTKGGDLYIWGQRASRPSFVADVSGEPTPIDLDHDVKDFAIGHQHAILLTTDGEIFVRGANKNGQLGQGEDTEWCDSWTKVNLPLVEGSEIVGVDAGDKTSFILTRHATGPRAS